MITDKYIRSLNKFLLLLQSPRQPFHAKLWLYWEFCTLEVRGDRKPSLGMPFYLNHWSDGESDLETCSRRSVFRFYRTFVTSISFSFDSHQMIAPHFRNPLVVRCANNSGHVRWWRGSSGQRYISLVRQRRPDHRLCRSLKKETSKVSYIFSMSTVSHERSITRANLLFKANW